MHPLVEITVNGAPVSAVFWSRLLSVTVTDREGGRSDTIQLELEDGPPHAEIPKPGASVTCAMGYLETGARFMGAFKVEDVTVKCLPWSIHITGKAAEFHGSKLKEPRERHWDKASVKKIVSDLAAENGLSPRIASAAGAHVYDWFGQQDESAIHVLERLARRHNALFSIKNGQLLFVDKGAGAAASGAALGAITITPPQIIQGTCSVHFAKREPHRQVEAQYQDRKKPERGRVTAPLPRPGGPATYRLRHAYADKKEAKRAAGSKAKDLSRGADTTSVTIEGDPSVLAGMGMTYAGVRPGVDGIAWIVEEAAHSYSKGDGYKTAIKAKRKA